MPPIDINGRDDAQAAIEVHIVFVNRMKEKIIDIRVMDVEQHPESVGIILWDYYLQNTGALKDLFTIGNRINSLFPTPERTKEHERGLRTKGVPTKQYSYEPVFTTLKDYQLDYLYRMWQDPGENKHIWIFTIDTKAPTTMRMMHLGKLAPSRYTKENRGELYNELHKSQRDPFSASRYKFKNPPTLGKAYIIQHRWQAVQFGHEEFKNMSEQNLSNRIQLLLQWQSEPKRGKEKNGEMKMKDQIPKGNPVKKATKAKKKPAKGNPKGQRAKGNPTKAKSKPTYMFHTLHLRFTD